MKKLLILLSLNSLIAFVVIVERLLPATKMLLQPYDFIRLHEINQTVIFLPLTVAIGIYTIALFTDNFRLLKEKGGVGLLALFAVGVYLYGAGEGWHEVASFTWNQYCHASQSILCKGLFFNDYYSGNVIFFIGAVFMQVTLMIFALRFPIKNYSKMQFLALILNVIVYAFTWFAYAAFDIVLFGLFFSALLMIISLWFVFQVRKNIKAYPFILYSALSYTLATVATIVVKFIH